MATASNKKSTAKKSTTKKSASTQKAKRASSPSEKKHVKKASVSVQEEPERMPLLDGNIKRNIAGVIFAVLAVALLLVVVWPTDAFVTSALSAGIHRLFGIGAYILPFLLGIIAFTFLASFEQERVPTRAAIGLTMIFLAVLILSSLFTPGAADGGTSASLVLADKYLVSRGGYIGGGIAWAGLTTLGLPVSVIIALGIGAFGFAIMGFSLSRLIEAVRYKREIAAIEDEFDNGVLLEGPRVRLSGGYSERQPADANAKTRALGWGHEGDLVAAGATQRLGGDAAQPAETQMITRRQSHPVSAAGATVAIPERKEEKQAKEKPQSDKKAASAATVALEDEEQDAQAYKLPPLSMLKVSKASHRTRSMEMELQETAARLQKTMEDFGIMATVVDWVAGPTVTLFEVDLPPGVRVSRLIKLNDDIALALAAPGVRIFAPIPGTHFVGIEVPNSQRENVLLGDVIGDLHGGPLDMAIGKDVEGNSIVCDLSTMPHLLIGGTTGSGKSIGINSMIMSMLMRATPDQVRFIMIDPKRVEFTPYNGIPHLYVPVVTEPKEAASALSWGVAEMERRLKIFAKAGARNINEYNEMADMGGTEDEAAQELPYIVIIIDELADLMMNVGKEVEFSISRIAQLARAAGIHLIVATQRPSANVVTGLIKANITNRMAFNVASSLDSRVILDVNGAESLIGKGDLLLSKPEYAKPLRIQGCFVSASEISKVVEFVRNQGEPEYHSEILKTNLITLGDSAPDGSGGSSSSDDPLLWEAAEIVVASGLGSTSNIQRKLKVGYSRAGRIMDMLEEKGVVGPPNGSKPRDVLVDALELETLKSFEAADGD